jgi:hypothetical protein
MLRSVSELEKYTIGATDGTIGSVKDCYFDDEAWVVRYLAVKTGSWLVGREVLISPLSVRDSDAGERVLHVSISKDQVKNSPSIDTQKPVSRQHEIGYSGRTRTLGRIWVSRRDAHGRRRRIGRYG